MAGFLSTFWNFGYTRKAQSMQGFLEAEAGAPRIKKQNVSQAGEAGARRSAHVT